METGLVPMPVLIRQVLAVTADQLPALLTGAGEQGLKAGHTVGLLLPKYVLPAEERVLAVVAVKALGHLGPGCLSPSVARLLAEQSTLTPETPCHFQ